MSDEEPQAGAAPERGTAKGRKYTRGVRASRLSLTNALLASGLTTQVALAAKIAELEELESPPKDSVSRAFREKSVDPVTLNRIARALGVEPHSLYLSATNVENENESEPLADASADALELPQAAALAPLSPAAVTATLLPKLTKPANPPPSARTVVAVALVVVVLAGWLGMASGPSATGSDSSTGVSPLVSLAPGGVLTVAMMPTPGHDDMPLHTAMSSALDHRVRLSAPSSGVLFAEGDAQELRQTLRTQVVLERTQQSSGRYISLAVRWSSEQDSGVLAADVGLAVERSQLERRVGVAAGVALLDLVVGNKQVAPPSKTAMQSYIAGRQLLDETSSDQTVRDAEHAFLDATERAPGWSLGHAGLCDAKLLNSWTDNEQRALQVAEPICADALRLGAAQPYVQAAWGHYLRRSGQASKAQAFLSATAGSASVAQLGQLAEVEFALYRQTSDNGHLDHALERLQRLVVLEPAYWRWHWLAGTYYYFQGDLAAAVTEGQAASALKDVPVVLVNLGMAQFCLGDVNGMLGSFERVTQLQPDSYLGHEYAGLARFYLGDFKAAVTLRRTAIERIGASGDPEIHDMWGGLGDALRHAGDAPGASVAYRQAAEILERDMLGGIASVSDYAHRAFYHAMLASLGDADEPQAGLIRVSVRRDLEQLHADDLDRSSRVRYAQVLVLLGKPAAASVQAEEAVEQCAGLAAHPDLVALLPG